MTGRRTTMPAWRALLRQGRRVAASRFCLGLPVLVALLSAFSFQPSVSADITTGLVAYYPFSGNANDASGNGNHGTVNGASLTNDRVGNSNSAYLFDGTNDFISIPDANILNLNSFTIAAWVKVRTLANDVIVNKAGVGENSSVDVNYSLEVLADGKVRVGYESSSVNYDLDSSATMSTGTWRLVAATRDAATGDLSIYIDGIKAASMTAMAVPNTQALPVIFGAWGQSAGNYFAGTIDDVRIYNRALTSAGVYQLAGGLNAGLVAHYKLDGNATDSSGNNKNGVNNGATGRRTDLEVQMALCTSTAVRTSR